MPASLPPPHALAFTSTALDSLRHEPVVLRALTVLAPLWRWASRRKAGTILRGRFGMNLSARVLGITTVKLLKDRPHEVLLRIGSDLFDRALLAKVECYNYAAARNLDYILNRELQVKNTRDLFDHIAPEALALPGLGVISLCVLGAAFEAKGIGGSHPLESWVNKHKADKALRTVTFHQLKVREVAREREAHPRRRRA